jgi:DNA modification methylase
VIHQGDLFDVLPTLDAESIDACVTDPPYGIGFMGREWDTFKPGTGKHRKLMHPRERQALDKIVSDNPNINGRTRSPALSPSQIDYDYSTAGLRGFQQWTERWAAEVLRVLKPGAYIVVCGAPRSHHRMMCGLEDAGFVVRDCFAWLFLSGFPKSHNFGCKCGGNALPYNHDAEPEAERDLRRVRGADVSTAVNAGDEQGQILLDGLPEYGAPAPRQANRSGVDEGREQPGLDWRQLHRAGEGLSHDSDAGSSASESERLRAGAYRRRGEDAGTPAEGGRGSASRGPRPREQRPGEPEDLRLPSSALADGASDRRARCERCGGLTAARGVGTALKPAHEPICIAWKPFKGTIAGNYITHGTGGLDIEGCRIGADRIVGTRGAGGQHGKFSPIGESEYDHFSRWPSNVLLESPEAYAEIAPYLYVAKPSRKERDYGCESLPQKTAAELTGRKPGSAGLQNPRAGIRAGSMDRDINARVARNIHPTVKPVELMRWLVRLVTPPGGTVLDPFTGSGTTGMACRYELRPFVGIEREADYIAIAERRIAAVAPLFGEATA